MVKRKKMLKVAILGSRGIPARYSGYDTLVEELSRGLIISKKARVLVYCRNSYYKKRPANLNGIQLIYLPAPRIKAVESLLHSFLSSVHVLGKNVDIVYFVDPANAPFCILLRLFGKRVLIHTDGLGWKRRKWGFWARKYYKFVEWLCVRVATGLVTDNPEMKKYYLREYNAESTYIPYGAKHHAGEDESIYEELDIVPEKYFLVVARLERENNTDFIIKEYSKAGINMPLIVVGDAPYDSGYMKTLRQISNKGVRFTGRINNQAKLNALYKGAYIYIHGHEVGGTNPSLLRAMNFGTAPVVINAAFNKSVIGECGIAFEHKNGLLSRCLEDLAGDKDYVKKIGNAAKKRADSDFNWESVVNKHAKLFVKTAKCDS